VEPYHLVDFVPVEQLNGVDYAEYLEDQQFGLI
jgi:hypothetical protein